MRVGLGVNGVWDHPVLIQRTRCCFEAVSELAGTQMWVDRGLQARERKQQLLKTYCTKPQWRLYRGAKTALGTKHSSGVSHAGQEPLRFRRKNAFVPTETPQEYFHETLFRIGQNASTNS